MFAGRGRTFAGTTHRRRSQAMSQATPRCKVWPRGPRLGCLLSSSATGPIGVSGLTRRSAAPIFAALARRIRSSAADAGRALTTSTGSFSSGAGTVPSRGRASSRPATSSASTTARPVLRPRSRRSRTRSGPVCPRSAGVNQKAPRESGFSLRHSRLGLVGFSPRHPDRCRSWGCDRAALPVRMRDASARPDRRRAAYAGDEDACRSARRQIIFPTKTKIK